MPLAEQLASALQKHGISAWADFKDLHTGENWAAAIERALDNAHWILILVTPHSLGSRWLEAEWRAAVTSAWSDSSKALIPILVGGTQPPPFLRGWAALAVDPVAEPGTWTNRVVDALRSTRSSALRDFSSEERQELRQRLNEAAHAAEEMDRGSEIRELGL
jgi:hypothetical protein